VANATAAEANTFPKLLIHNARTRGDKPALRHKDLGIWQTWTWSQVLEEVRAFALGLESLGIKRGDKIAIIGANKPRLYWAICAAQALGAVPVPLYADSVADEMAYVLEHAEVTVAVAENQEQVDKIVSIADRVPKLTHLIYDEPRGLRDYDHSRLTWINEVLKAGHEKLKDPAERERFETMVAQGKGGDLAIILYTSGTTGRPKGRDADAGQCPDLGAQRQSVRRPRRGEEVIAYLPIAWVGDHIFSFAQSYVAGFCVNCPESGETVVEDRREIGTTYAFAPPRVYENLLTLTMVRMEDAGPLMRGMFNYFIRHARRWGEKILNKEKCRWHARLIYSARRHSGLCAAQEPLRPVQDPRRLHRRARRSAGDFQFLSFARHQPETALRLDRRPRFTSPRSRTAKSIPTPSASRISASR
jgi:long-chain acyl-CoA synthetase